MPGSGLSAGDAKENQTTATILEEDSPGPPGEALAGRYTETTQELSGHRGQQWGAPALRQEVRSEGKGPCILGRWNFIQRQKPVLRGDHGLPVS